MRKTDGMRKLEVREGRDVRAIIRDAVRDAGSVPLAAERFGMTPAGLYQWIQLLNGEVQQRTDVLFADWNGAEEPQLDHAEATA